MSTTFKPYTYLIGWSSLNKWYYGVQYGQSANPINLWTNYFTSSKYVKEYRELYGEPDIIEVRKTFSSKEKAIRWEFKVIQRLNCVRSEQWLNRSLAGQKFNYGQHTEETKHKISLALFGKTHTEETKHKISISQMGEKNNNFRKPFSKETREKISLANTGKQKSEETKQKISNSLVGENSPLFGITGEKHPRYGKTHSVETKLKMSSAQSGMNNPMFGKTLTQSHKEKLSHALIGKNRQEFTVAHKENLSTALKNRQKFECPHCNKFFDKSNLTRWHNDNCKQKYL